MALAERPGAIIFEGRDEELSARLDTARKNREFLEAHIEAWRQEHPDEWVAVYQMKAVAFTPSLDAMIAKLRELGIPSNQAALEWLSTDDAIYVL